MKHKNKKCAAVPCFMLHSSSVTRQNWLFCAANGINVTSVHVREKHVVYEDEKCAIATPFSGFQFYRSIWTVNHSPMRPFEFNNSWDRHWFPMRSPQPDISSECVVHFVAWMSVCAWLRPLRGAVDCQEQFRLTSEILQIQKIITWENKKKKKLTSTDYSSESLNSRTK